MREEYGLGGAESGMFGLDSGIDGAILVVGGMMKWWEEVAVFEIQDGYERVW